MRAYKYRKLTTKEAFDVETMKYFIPRNRLSKRLQRNDKRKIADLSSRGIQPRRDTPGYIDLRWGKTYRDWQITQWRRDVAEGLFTKWEIINSVPQFMQSWLEDKLLGIFSPEDDSYLQFVRKIVYG